MNAPVAMVWLVYPTVGVVLGVLYFYAVFRTARLHVAGAPLAKILPLYVLRAGGAVLAFVAVAWQGALPLLLTLLGFVGARFIVQRLLGPA